MTESYDVIVIGGGPPGENAADHAVQGGLSTVLVEHELVGGECSYWACMPSKALLRPPAALTDARHVDGARQAVTGDLDRDAVLARRDSFAAHWRDDGQVRWLDSAGIEFVRGHARLAGERTVHVQTAEGTTELTAGHAVIVAVGSDAAIPPVPGLADARPWTSRDATSAKEAPGRLVVIGGGVVACEMATAWAALGSRVTMLVRDRRLLPSVEAFAGEMVIDALRGAGVDVRLGTEAARADRGAPGGPVSLALRDGGQLEADEVLVATGRRPRTGDLGLDSVGLPPGDWLEVDDTCRVPGYDWLYAVGDVNSRALLTHMGKYQGRACGDAIAARARGEQVDGTAWSRFAATADNAGVAAVPQVIFTIPEVAAVGRTEEQARAAGLRVRGVEYDLGQVAGASLYADGYTGRAKIVVDEDRQVLIGVTMIGAGVAEMLHAATVSVVAEVPLSRLWHAVPAYPTVSEIWLRLLESYGRDSA